MMNKFTAIAAIAIAVGACRGNPKASAPADTRPAAGVAHVSLSPLGAERNPVRGRGPFGEREYLRRLRCSDGTAPTFERGGSVGEGGDEHILDVYSVLCPGAGRATSVYMDMYHDDVRERRPIPGFTVLAELPARTALGCPPQAGPSPDSSARYVFNYLEVETPAHMLNRPAAPIKAGFEDYVSVGFVVDTLGRVEPGSLQMGEFDNSRAQAAAERIVLALRFTPAEHHAGCRVRQGTGVDLEFQ